MAFLQEPERQPVLRGLAATTGLLVALVAAHIARVEGPLLRSQAILADYAFYPVRYSHKFLVTHSMDPGSVWDRAIPFVGYVFLHANYAHLAFNCVWLLLFGPLVARRFGALLFFVFFLICGVAGAAAHLVTNWGTLNYLIGASAAASGLMAAGIRIVAPVQTRDVAGLWAAVGASASSPLAPIFSQRVLVCSGLWIGLNVLAWLTGLGAGSGAQLVGWQAHIASYLVGLFLADPFDIWERRLRF